MRQPITRLTMDSTTAVEKRWPFRAGLYPHFFLGELALRAQRRLGKTSEAGRIVLRRESPGFSRGECQPQD